MSESTTKKRRSVKQAQYKGKLNAQQVHDGIDAAHLNTVRLAADARLLFDNGRLPSAVALAILAIEESGKFGILQGMLGASEAELKSAWRDYRSHTRKNAFWPLIFDALSGVPRAPADIEDLFKPDAEHAQLLEDVKQISLYSDCLDLVTWWIPGNRKDAELTDWLVRAAEELVSVTVHKKVEGH